MTIVDFLDEHLKDTLHHADDTTSVDEPDDAIAAKSDDLAVGDVDAKRVIIAEAGDRG